MLAKGRDLISLLRKVEKPGRYVGGEFGAMVKPDPVLTVALSYPDLYEIGMSNAAIRILYSLLNAIPGVSCERVFAPAPDFEDALRSAGIPLFSLETGRPLSQFDLIGFSVARRIGGERGACRAVSPLCRRRHGSGRVGPCSHQFRVAVGVNHG